MVRPVGLPRWIRVACCSLLCVAGVGAASVAAQAPRLVVVLVIDQFRADYIETYGSRWTGGLRRLLDEGAWFTEAAYPYHSTVTCAGHSTISTGNFPATHGMIANSWWDRDTERRVRCTFDPETPAVSYSATNVEREGESGHRFLVPTLPDEMRTQLDGVRVATFSLKERSAIGLAGQRADALLWLGGDGSWLTSRAFSPTPVTFLADVLRADPLSDAVGQAWERVGEVETYLHADDAEGERPPAEWARTFPHPLSGAAGAEPPPFLERWKTSPWSDAYLGTLGRAAIDSLALGQRDSVDYLGIGFSALDLVGHRFGPRSHEVQDLLRRLDRTIGELLDALDREVGAGRYVVALSADHGVSPIPEQMQAEGFDAGRVLMRPIGARLEAVLELRFGPGPHVAAVTAGGVYFAPGLYDRLTAYPTALDATIAALAGSPGVGKVFRREALMNGTPADPDARAVALSFHPDRSGDLLFTQKPYWMSGVAASHGTSNRYDQEVPVVLYGAGVRPGRYRGEVTPADIAPTLGRMIGVTLPRPDGRVLTEALAPR
ncbi:MAG TPA: hypothetical protein DCP38_10390 [Acidobacteria bacterium]|nr:hypothetical protein [Acidobacteriota bacterium]HAK55872.1 hypothetical protein [Acidobacteriota bacterium]